MEQAMQKKSTKMSRFKSKDKVCSNFTSTTLLHVYSRNVFALFFVLVDCKISATWMSSALEDWRLFMLVMSPCWTKGCWRKIFLEWPKTDRN